MLTTTKSRLNQLGIDTSERDRNQTARQSQATKNEPATIIMVLQKLSASGL